MTFGAGEFSFKDYYHFFLFFSFPFLFLLFFSLFLSFFLIFFFLNEKEAKNREIKLANGECHWQINAAVTSTKDQACIACLMHSGRSRRKLLPRNDTIIEQGHI